MDELDPATFVTGVFDKGFNLIADSLVPIVFMAEHIGLVANFQTLTEACGTFDEMMKIWWSFIGLSTLGQFSAIHQKQIFALIRYDVEVRRPSDTEMQADFERFGEQVMGQEVDAKKHDGEPRFSFLEQLYYYTGPLRFKKAVFTLRIIEGGTPSAAKVRELISDVDENVAGGELNFQRYFALAISQGVMKYGDFGKSDEFIADALLPLGSVSVNEEKTQMLFYPGEENEPMDFSGALYCPA